MRLIINGCSFNMAKREFVRKPHQWGIYKWSPSKADIDKKKRRGERNLLNKKGKNFCDAKAHSKNGEDWFTTYCYNQTIDNNGIKHRYAYVACGYVE